MSAPVISPKRSYDAQNEATFREEVRRKLDGSYDRRSNLTVPFGKKLQFTSAQGQVITFGYNAGGEFTVQQDASTPFGLASISYVSTVESTLTTSLATLETSLTAEVDGLSATVTTVASGFADLETSFAALEALVEAVDPEAAAEAAAASAAAAATSATAAGTSATASQASSVSAQNVANRLIPERISVAADFATGTTLGEPSTVTPTTTGTVVAVAGEGDVREVAIAAVFGTRGALAVGTGRTFRLQSRMRTTVDGTPSLEARSLFGAYDASWTYLGQVSLVVHDSNLTVAEGWQNYSQETTSTAVLAAWPTAAYLRGRAGSTAVNGGTFQIAFIRFQDITSEAAAAGSATAASTSASAASTSATAAGTSATAANTSATNAATSAGAASTSATNASTSATTASGHAATSSTQATNAANSATAAGGSATAAAGSATTAATQATNAATSATAAGTSATSASTSATSAATQASNAATSAAAASTSAGAASTSATNASTSASNAAGSASAASTSATAAATSATNAGNSATAASTSASTASTQATNAGNSATSAATSAVTAQSVANRILPDRPAIAADFITALGSTPDASTPMSSGTVVAVAGEGDVRQISGARLGIYTRGGFAVASGKTYRAESRQRVTVDGTSNRAVLALQVFDVSWTNLGVLATTVDATAVVADGWQNFSYERTAAQVLASFATAAYVRAGVIVNDTASNTYSGATTQVATLALRDVTSEAASAASATAASTSASSAATSATSAGTSATAASTSATNAATSAGAASTSATNAASSATTASGHAATSSTQATNAANSATAAGGSATAAAGSATTASTQATNASNSATSASASSVAAKSTAIAQGIGPADFGADGLYYTNTFGGAASAAADPVGAYANISGEGRVLQGSVAGTGTAGYYLTQKYAMVPRAGRKYKLTARIRVTTNATGGGVLSSNFYINGLDTALAHGVPTFTGTSVSGFSSSINPINVASGWQTISIIYTLGTPSTYDAFWRPRLDIIRTGGGSAGGSWEVAFFRIEDVTDSEAAAASATAAATSASSASTSATAAGTSATAASTSATNASTSAGSASTSATNASTSATNASTSASGAATSASAAATSATTATTQASNASTSASSASTSAGNAASSATTATTQASNAAGSASSASSSASAASASATSASSSATLSASYSGASNMLVRNARFLEPFSGTAHPPGWSDWSNGGGTHVARLNGAGNAFRLVGAAGVQNGQLQAIPGVNPGPYTLRGSLRRISGTIEGAALYVAFYNISGTFIGDNSIVLYNTPNTSGATSSTPDGVNTWEKRVTAPANTYSAAVLFMSHWSSAGSIAVANSIDWYECDLIPESLTSAQVQTNASAISTINGAAAFWETIVSASGGDLAAVRLKAGASGSYLELISTVLRLANVSNGSVIEVMRATGGEAYFSRPVSVDYGSKRLTIGPGYGVSGSELFLWVGANTVAPSSQSRLNCDFAIGSDGKTYFSGTELALAQGLMTVVLTDYAPTYSGFGTGVKYTASTTATPSGGLAPYTYDWTIYDAHGATGAPTATSPTSATTTFNATIGGPGEVWAGTFRCRVRDSAGRSVDVYLEPYLESL